MKESLVSRQDIAARLQIKPRTFRESVETLPTFPKQDIRLSRKLVSGAP